MRVDEGSAKASVSGWRGLQWWPSLAGLSFAAFVAFDLFRGEEGGADLAAIVAASGLVYLAAAALDKPISAWPVFFVSVVIITVGRFGWIDADPTWVLLGLALALFVYGLVRNKTPLRSGLPLQSMAMLVFGAAAALALFVDRNVGAYTVAGGLLAHAAWDVYHHWTNKVVTRSMAEFCGVLDVSLAAAIVIATVSG